MTLFNGPLPSNALYAEIMAQLRKDWERRAFIAAVEADLSMIETTNEGEDDNA